MGGFLFGYDSAVINGAVKAITAHFSVSAGVLGFAVASALLGAAVGALGAGRVADRYGRLPAMRAAAVLFLIGAVGSGLASSLVMLVVFRVIGGVAVGVASVIAPTYIAEIAPARIRGRLGSLQQLAIVTGIFLALLVDYALDTAAGGSSKDPRAGSGGVAVDVPGDGGPRTAVRRAGVHDSGVAALPGCQSRWTRRARCCAGCCGDIDLGAKVAQIRRRCSARGVRACAICVGPRSGCCRSCGSGSRCLCFSSSSVST